MKWFRGNWDTVIAIIIVIASIGSLIYIWIFSHLETSERVGITTAIATVALVITTAVYAWHTRQMAEEMREQRLSEARPYLLSRITNGAIIWPPPDNEFKVTIKNEGKGPAINIYASLWHPKTIHPYDSKGYLSSGEDWQAGISTSDVGVPYEGEAEVRPWLPELKTIINDQKFGAVVVRYNDIFKRNYLSYLSLSQIEEDVPYITDGEQNIIPRSKQ